jgi:hypothetical protein
MNPEEFLKLLNRIYVYTPSYLSIHKEVKTIIDQIKNSKQKYPHIEIIEDTVEDVVAIDAEKQTFESKTE